jgi:opacity protein-like surface antigen
MKKILFIVSIIVLCSSFSFAGGMIGFGVQATGAALNVAEPLKSVYGVGYGGGAHLDINLPMVFGIRVAADYTTYAPDIDKLKSVLGTQTGNLASGFEIDGGRVNIFSVMANAKFGLPTPVLSPYLTGGVGIASISTTDMTVKFQGAPVPTAPGASSGTKTSVNIGAGVELNLVLTLYLEAKYTVIFTDGESSSFVPVSVGVTF